MWFQCRLTWKRTKNNVLTLWLTLKVTGQCRRCQMIGVDQDTGTKSKELLLSLSAHCTGKVSLNSCVFVMLIMPQWWQWWALKCLQTESWNTLVFSYISSWLSACTWPINLQTAVLLQVVCLLAPSYNQSGTAREKHITLSHLVSKCLSLAVMLHCKTQGSPFKHSLSQDDAHFICVCSLRSFVPWHSHTHCLHVKLYLHRFAFYTIFVLYFYEWFVMCKHTAAIHVKKNKKH